MISYNTLSTFILHHDINRLCDKNICSIQDLMRTGNPDSDKFKRVCEDFPNLAILIKRASPGELQLMFAHTYIGYNSLGVCVSAFALEGSLEAPKFVSIEANISFSNAIEKIHSPITEVLL